MLFIRSASLRAAMIVPPPMSSADTYQSMADPVAVESQQIADLTRHIRDVRIFQNVMHIEPTLIVQRTAASVIFVVCVCGPVPLHEQLSIAQHLRIFF